MRQGSAIAHDGASYTAKHVPGHASSFVIAETVSSYNVLSSQVKCIYTGTHQLFPTLVLTLAFCQSYFVQFVLGDTVQSIYPLSYVSQSTPILSTSWKERVGRGDHFQSPTLP